MALIKVLHIEDEEMYQKLVGEILVEQGYDVTCASTAAEGLRMLEEIKPDLLILDINLPDADGYEICKRLRQEERWAKLPILLATVRRHPEEWRKGFSAGASDYVAKPLYGPELVERVRAGVAGKTAQGDGATNPEVLMIRATLIGNRGAFDVFVRQYKEGLLKTMQRICRNTSVAEDIVSTTFARAYERLEQFRGDSHFFTWLYCIAKNELKHHRRQGAHLSFDDMPMDDEGDPRAMAGIISDGDINNPGKLFDLELQEAISEIPRRYRKPLELHLQGVPYQKIASQMELPEGTIMSRLSRGKEHLRKVWQTMTHSSD